MKKLILAIFTLSLISCATQPPEYRLGEFTAASSFNIRNLKYDTTNSKRVTGEDCYAVGAKPNDSRLQRAMDNAIKKGQDMGITGDLLVNVRIDQVVEQKPGFLHFLTVPYNCIKVEGELVTVK